jgi:diguanylate cyclase (GGDEF)-like protein
VTRRRRLTVSVSLVSVFLLALGESMAGSAVDVSVFYLVPILLTTLLVGESLGLAFALLSAALYAVVSVKWLADGLPMHTLLLNDFFKLMAFSYVALAGSWITRQRDRLHLQARTDALTGLPNYRALCERLEEEVARAHRYQHGLTLIALDLDHFKHYNDRVGHEAGNVLLQQVARLVQLTIRQSDRAFRYGGDEIVVLLPETGAGAAALLAERIRAGIEREHATGPVSVTASFGVACVHQHRSASALLAKADAAMYRAKRAGGNRIVLDEADDIEAPAPALAEVTATPQGAGQRAS